MVDEPSSVNVDAATSASVLIPVHAAVMASCIQQKVGGDLFSIRVAEPYPSDYDQCLDRTADAVFTFVEEHDLSCKTVFSFVAHGTGGLSSTIRDLTAALPEAATVLEPVGIYWNDMPQAQEGIGY
ncbi:hypothetical protein AGATL06_17760 [Agathobaculum sp. TL06]